MALSSPTSPFAILRGLLCVDLLQSLLLSLACVELSHARLFSESGMIYSNRLRRLPSSAALFIVRSQQLNIPFGIEVYWRRRSKKGKSVGDSCDLPTHCLWAEDNAALNWTRFAWNVMYKEPKGSYFDLADDAGGVVANNKFVKCIHQSYSWLVTAAA